MISKSQETSQIPEAGYMITYEQLNTLLTFMKLWTDLGMWTRSLMISTVGNVDNKEAVVNQLFTVPGEIYNTMRIFYGPTITQRILDLLTNFITYEWRLIEALEAGDREGVDQSTVSLYQTADELAAFLSQINVYWYEDQWQSLLYQYIRLMIDEMVALMAGEYEREIEIYKRLNDVTDLIGSYMARGIIARSVGIDNASPM